MHTPQHRRLHEAAAAAVPPRRREVRPDRRALVQGVGRHRRAPLSPPQHLCSVLPTCVRAQAMTKTAVLGVDRSAAAGRSAWER